MIDIVSHKGMRVGDHAETRRSYTSADIAAFMPWPVIPARRPISCPSR